MTACTTNRCEQGRKRCPTPTKCATTLHTRNGGTVVEDGKALKKKPVDIATLVFEAGVLFLIMLPIFC